MIHNSKQKMYLLVIIFIIPVALSWFFYYYHFLFHFNTSNHGVLLNPPLEVSTFINNGPSKPQAKTWKIVFAPSNCNDAKADHIMFQLHQLRRALGENERRVSLVLLVDTSCQLQDTHDFAKVVLSPVQMATLQKQLSVNDHLITNKIYLVDTLNNLFMYYPALTQPMNIFQDLKRVLEVSQIG